MSKRKASGFSTIEALLALLAVVIIVGTGWFVWQSRAGDGQAESQATNAQTKTEDSSQQDTETKTISTDDWVSYSNQAGSFSLKHPKTWVKAERPELCTEGLALFGADKDSVGVCASENAGQIIVYSLEGARDDDLILTEEYYKDIKTTLVEINGIQGSRKEGTAQKQMTEEGLGGLPDGTKVTQYVFVANNDRTYMAQYVQASGYPNALAEFEVMVTKTLRFTP